VQLLELFSGTQSITKVFKRNGWNTFTLDFNDYFTNTDWITDVLKTTPQDFVSRMGGKPDVIWASPPCTTFSVASIGKHWNKDNTPKTEAAEIGLKILEHTLYLIWALQPKYYFIENPMGKMRKIPIMDKMNMYTVTYCQYGDNRMKPTDIWTNHPNPNFKPMCKKGMPCHEAAPRGTVKGTQGLKNSIEKAIIPEELCQHIFNIVKDDDYGI
jgi:site-specific DNA-cytosine methylase